MSVAWVRLHRKWLAVANGRVRILLPLPFSKENVVAGCLMDLVPNKSALHELQGQPLLGPHFPSHRPSYQKMFRLLSFQYLHLLIAKIKFNRTLSA